MRHNERVKLRRWLFLSVFALLVLYTGYQAYRLFPADPLGDWLAVVAFLLGSIATLRRRRWAWAGATALGFWAAFVLLSLPLELFYRVPASVRILGALGAAGAIAAAGLRQALRGPALREVHVPIAGLPEALEGLRIAQISDLHVGPTIGRAYVERVARRVRELSPDLIAVTGDLVDGKVADLAADLEPLRGLSAPLGVYYVTGNHEYYWGALPWLAKVRELGLRPLVDEGVAVEAGGAKVFVAGVPDVQASWFVPAHRSDPAAAAAGAGGCALKLLLAHRPESCEEAEKAGFDLQLSGHTHGGQFFPFRLLLPLASRYVRGLHRHGRMWVYVSCGTGYWGPPNRFTVPAELTLLTLKRA